MNKLVISAHADDEVLGCSSVLDEDTIVSIISVNEGKLEGRPHRDVRLDEACKVSDYLGHQSFIGAYLYVNEYTVKSVLNTVELDINRFKPEEIYIPSPVSYNQDHKVVYEACLIALRPHDKNWFVPKVLIYEQPHTFLWSDEQFQPRYFRELDLSKKLNAYHLYKTQVRSFRSDETITSLAKLRGDQVGYSWAEAFDILREVVK